MINKFEDFEWIQHRSDKQVGIPSWDKGLTFVPYWQPCPQPVGPVLAGLWRPAGWPVCQPGSRALPPGQLACRETAERGLGQGRHNRRWSSTTRGQGRGNTFALSVPEPPCTPSPCRTAGCTRAVLDGESDPRSREARGRRASSPVLEALQRQFVQLQFSSLQPIHLVQEAAVKLHAGWHLGHRAAGRDADRDEALAHSTNANKSSLSYYI